jgi:hypothetical protein
MQTDTVSSALMRLAKDPNRASNLLGVILVTVGSSTLNWDKILSGDLVELRRLGTLAIIGALSWYIGKPPESKTKAA